MRCLPPVSLLQRIASLHGRVWRGVWAGVRAGQPAAVFRGLWAAVLTLRARLAVHRLVLAGALALGTSLVAGPAWAQGVDLNTLKLTRQEHELVLEYSARLGLNPVVEDALQRGIPLYFEARATLMRKRWYWRDERVARISRTWRVAYQPLTASWRVSLGGLSQVYGSLSEALAPMSRVSGWPLVEIEKLESGERYYVDFSFKLDNSKLPPPLQIDVSNDYKLGIERSQPLE